MKEWKLKNGIKVCEAEFISDLHCLEVYNGEQYLGTVYPGCIGDMESCFKDLDLGKDPISDGWEDGLGNQCVLDGWGDDEQSFLQLTSRIPLCIWDWVQIYRK